ncbi:MAG: NUDIX domain-containing protein [Alphaproteobacteria bacterium]|jgi:8-oxo-dGTP diphosphatase|nr:NUDIX domain-containing protein [Rhodospirillaceae bacterium]MBT6510427.1 NUDIX domain-containing protein [Rhodospirillaceae bacterium]MBT7614812.1 NUDIX domain-containing protein [Rhodospirillaceae bacterium]MBT7649273.1 NUDIX domain-containing protein [Rhodospirillaceae bacterium]MDG2479537.1 NUDIX domain-containing protein [Alphaproteobacteria bacterium]
MIDIVNGLLVRDGLVLMAKRSRHRCSYPDTWSFPGGHVEPGETFGEALVRELREELGIVATDWSRLGTTTDNNASPADCPSFHVFVVRTWDGGEPVLRGDEHNEMAWFSPRGARLLEPLAVAGFGAMLDRLPEA